MAFIEANRALYRPLPKARGCSKAEELFPRGAIFAITRALVWDAGHRVL
jgi:hypothetical protein